MVPAQGPIQAISNPDFEKSTSRRAAEAQSQEEKRESKERQCTTLFILSFLCTALRLCVRFFLSYYPTTPGPRRRTVYFPRLCPLRGPAATALAVVAFFLVSRLSPLAADPPKEPDPEKIMLPLDKVIEYQQADLKRNPKDYIRHTLLAQTYLRKAREMGDLASYDLAEAAARRALALKKDYAPAQASLAVALSAQHKFVEAMSLAREVYRKNPDEHTLLSVIGDAQLELGDYEAAEKTYRELQKKEPSFYLHSRRARLAELRGQTDEALKEMRRAVQKEAPNSISKEGMAWFSFRLGEMYFHGGQLDKAAPHLEEALKLNPSYPLALAWLGKVRAGQGKLDEAIKLYVKAVSVSGDLPMLADLGDLYAKTGKDFLARLSYDKLEKSAKGKANFARELSLFYSNHDRNVDDAVDLARQDLRVRKDVYAYDTLAWALCKKGQFKDAAEAMDEALKLGTKDASLFYHAGMIQAGLGDKDKARDYLKKALELNPHFSLLQADEARKALEGLK